MADEAVKSRRFCRTPLIYCILAGIAYCILMVFDGCDFIPGVLFGGEAYLHDGTLHSMVLIQLPVIANLLILDWPMHRFAASPIVSRYRTRLCWSRAFLLSATRTAAVIYLVQYGILAAASALQGKPFIGWNVMVLPTLACNICALVVCYCYIFIAERSISRASCFFLFIAVLFIVGLLPEGSLWSGLRLALPISYFHFELMNSVCRGEAVLSGMMIHLGLAALFFTFQARRINFIK